MRTYSVQLYTVREALAADRLAALSKVRQLGFEVVEPYRFADDPAALATQLAELGLRAPSAHTRFLGADQDAIFQAAARLGTGILIQPASEAALWLSSDGIASLATQFNEAAARAADYGLRLGYHNHSFEYAGGLSSPLERFADLLREDIALEVDTYWAAVGGDDPVRLLRALAERAALLHLKDGPITLVPRDQVAVGAGAMPIAEILAAAPHALAVVELDDCASDVFEALSQSLQFLGDLP